MTTRMDPRTNMATRMPPTRPEGAPHPAALVRLLGWLSPGFPVGGFAYSHALEAAYERHTVHDRATLHAWLEGLLVFGNAQSDAALLACAHRAVRADDDEALAAVASLGATLFGAPELARESLQQGEAFWRTVTAAWPHPALAHLDSLLARGRIAYPIAVGAAAAVHEIGALETCAAYLHAFVANGVSAALRLGMIGQTDGEHVLRGVEPTVLAAATEACDRPLEDIGSASLAVDLHALAHETQTTRLFRS